MPLINGSAQCSHTTKGIHPLGHHCCRILGKQTGDKWHYRSLQMRIATKGWRNHHHCSRWWGGGVKGPHRCLGQPQRSALAQLPLCSKDFWCSALTTLLIQPHPCSQTNTAACFTILIYTLLTHVLYSPSSLISAVFPRGFWNKPHNTMPPAVNRVTMCHSHGGTEHRLQDCFCPHLLLLRATGSISFSLQTFVTEKCTMKSLIPLLLILFLSCKASGSCRYFYIKQSNC